MMCEGSMIFFTLDKYKRFEVDTIVIVGYVPNTNFSVVTDSSVFITPNVTGDTSRAIHSHSVKADRDFIIKLPSANKHIKIADFNTTTARCECGNKKYTVVKSFTVDGVMQTNPFFSLPR